VEFEYLKCSPNAIHKVFARGDKNTRSLISLGYFLECLVSKSSARRPGSAGCADGAGSNTTVDSPVGPAPMPRISQSNEAP
jgi:hypothetical protein